MPQGRAWRPWDQERILEWATRIGLHTRIAVERIFESVAVTEQAINPALAVLRLSHRYTPTRVEAAAGMALEAGVHSPRYAHLHPILAAGRDKSCAEDATWSVEDPAAGFVRGASYYSGEQR